MTAVFIDFAFAKTAKQAGDPSPPSEHLCKLNENVVQILGHWHEATLEFDLRGIQEHQSTNCVSFLCVQTSSPSLSSCLRC